MRSAVAQLEDLIRLFRIKAKEKGKGKLSAATV